MRPVRGNIQASDILFVTHQIMQFQAVYMRIAVEKYNYQLVYHCAPAPTRTARLLVATNAPFAPKLTTAMTAGWI